MKKDGIFPHFGDTPTRLYCYTSLDVFILIDMGYESVSALIVLIILVALWFGWLPKRTVNGMKTMLEHREDRFSPTLHLVGEWSAARICDGTGMLAKGACMQPTQRKRTLTPERIARIRAARRAAIRRRCVLVGALAVLTVLVFIVGCSGAFSPAFVLIPGAMLAAVLYFGSRAAKHAREWEARVAKMRAGSLESVDSANDSLRNKSLNGESLKLEASKEQSLKSEPSESVEQHSSRDDTATSVMEKGEIKVALMRAQEERNAALLARSEATENAENVAEDIDEKEYEEDFKEANLAVKEDSKDSAAVKNNQDLISFSLGSDVKYDLGDSVAAAKAPESLEIKSTKQVAKAIPVVKPAKSKAIKSKAAKSAKTSESKYAKNLQKSTSSQFHAEEQKSQVEAPASSADSLGVANLREVLARRNA